MKYISLLIFAGISLGLLLIIYSCAKTASDTPNPGTLHDAFAADNLTIYLDGTEVVIESNGRPNHTSSYSPNDDENPIGIISDVFFRYAHKGTATEDYPTELDQSGGHTALHNIPL